LLVSDPNKIKQNWQKGSVRMRRSTRVSTIRWKVAREHSGAKESEYLVEASGAGQ